MGHEIELDPRLVRSPLPDACSQFSMHKRQNQWPHESATRSATAVST